MSSKVHRTTRVGLLRKIVFVLAIAAVLLAVAAVLDVGLVVKIGVLALAPFAIGVILWLHPPDGEMEFGDIGRSLMLGVFLAVVVGVPQYLLDQREKHRDFVLSLTMEHDLTGADLHDKDLSDVRLQDKVLAEADLSDTQLEGARLVGTDLRGADLRDANLREADLRGAKLQGAALDGADLTDARLKDANLTQASLPDADLIRTQLQNSSLVGACLAGAELRDADLGGVDLAGAVLTGADVEGAKFESDLRPASGLGVAGLADLRNSAEAEWPEEFSYAAEVDGEADRPAGAPRPGSGQGFMATVTGVSDGDTLSLERDRPDGPPLSNGGRAALLGVEAPDPDDTNGPAATGYLRRVASGERVRVQVGGDRRDDGGRMLVHIWLADGRMLNEMMVEAGRATHRVEHETRLSARLGRAETRAKERGAGLWESCPQPEERIAPEGVEIRTT